MTDAAIISLGREALWTALLIAGPLLGFAMVTGLAISILQATTQINEQTLTFVPKIIVTFLTALILGPWMLRVMMEFTSRVFSMVSLVTR